MNSPHTALPPIPPLTGAGKFYLESDSAGYKFTIYAIPRGLQKIAPGVVNRDKASDLLIKLRKAAYSVKGIED